MENEPNGTRLLLKWWPIIVTFVAWIALGVGAYHSLRNEILQSRTQIVEVKIELSSHEQAQAEATSEQNRRLATIEADVKELLRRGK